jgi:hypothetical protein
MMQQRPALSIPTSTGKKMAGKRRGGEEAKVGSEKRKRGAHVSPAIFLPASFSMLPIGVIFLLVKSALARSLLQPGNRRPEERTLEPPACSLQPPACRLLFARAPSLLDRAH